MHGRKQRRTLTLLMCHGGDFTSLIVENSAILMKNTKLTTVCIPYILISKNIWITPSDCISGRPRQADLGLSEVFYAKCIINS